MDLVVDAPINSLSFGNVSYNILRQFWRKGVNVNLFPHGEKGDFSAFDKMDKEFLEWLKESSSTATLKVRKDTPSFKLWHLNGSQNRVGPKQALYTFYELDQPTEVEINLAKLQDKIYFSSEYSANLFKEKGVDALVLPVGFDEDFHRTNKTYLSEEVVHFGLMGKFEHRKHTEKIIKLWLSKYGNNNKYQLSVCVTNPFLNKEEMQSVLANCLGGKRYSNINFLPYLKSNTEVNELLNSIDIDLTGLSGAEGWNMPAFNSTCLGKWSIVLNETAHKDWANNSNCILVESDGKVPAYDNKFFKEGLQFNQGNIYTWDSDIVAECMDTAVSKKGQTNAAGEELKDKFSYSRSVDRLLKGIEEMS
tara:strand:+ start:1439 stop:2527 length:1089 start_codon:yes stop_codon:yes gene_type:complete